MVSRRIEQMVDEQVRRWEHAKSQEKREASGEASLVTVSREPGSGGQLIAERLAEALGYDMFHQNIVHRMAESSNVSAQLLHSLDEDGINIIEEWLTGFSQHLWPDQYLKQLIRVIGSIGQHGRAVIVGRGANFILPLDYCFRVRVVASRRNRVRNVAHEFGVSEQEAERRIVRAESDRSAFIRKYFHTDVTDPHNYDLLLNTDRIGLDECVAMIRADLEQMRQGS